MIGKEGSTLEGQGFIQRLWADANAHFAQVQPLAKKDKDGNLVGIWGAMSDFPAHTNRGKKTSAKACTLQVWNVWMRRSRPKAGQNGTSRAMSIFVPRWKRKIHFQRCWIICRRIKSRWWEQSRIFPVRKAERIICFSRFEDFKGHPLPGQTDNKRRPMQNIGRRSVFYSARVGWSLMVTATRLGIQTALCG